MQEHLTEEIFQQCINDAQKFIQEKFPDLKVIFPDKNVLSE